MRIRKKFLSLVLVGALLASLPVTALAKGPEKKDIDYVALGDSLAAGWTPYGENGLGYPEYLAKRFEQSQYTVDLANFAFPGFTSGQLVEQVKIDVVMEGIQEAEIITIDIGGNDILAALMANATGVFIPAAIVQVTENLGNILETIDRLNPNAKVYVMGYYNVFPYASPAEQAALLPILDTLNNTIEQLSIYNGDTFVPTSKIIAKDYETYLPNQNDIHLSLEGYQQVAKEFWKYIDKSK